MQLRGAESAPRVDVRFGQLSIRSSKNERLCAQCLPGPGGPRGEHEGAAPDLSDGTDLRFVPRRIISLLITGTRHSLSRSVCVRVSGGVTEGALRKSLSAQLCACISTVSSRQKEQCVQRP